MNHRQTLSVCSLVAIAACLAIAAPARAEEEQDAAATQTVEPAAAEQPPATTPDDREAEKQRRATAGLLALCGILIGGLMFVIFVMIWGARLRRLARRDLPAQTTLHNEHWYLKPPKGSRETKVESQEPDSSQDRNAGS